MRPHSTLLIGALTLMACGDDAASTDAAVGDAATDAPAADAAPVDAMAIDAGPYDPAYMTLSETGMYSDFANKVVDPALIMFEPAYLLWSDEAIKRRWILLPAGQKIDTSNMDNWRFPVGTKIFKQFSYQPDVGDEIILETRLIERIAAGDDADDWWRGSFSWIDAAGDPLDDPELITADRSITLPDRPEPHIVPANVACAGCHDGSSHRILGFQAIQLTHNKSVGGKVVNTDWLWSEGWLSHEPASGGYPVPGNATDQEALGYLHANCGHCHSPPEVRSSVMACYDTTSTTEIPNMALRLRVTDTTVESTLAYQATVNQAVKATTHAGGRTVRIVPGDATNSETLYRMSVRGTVDQMPPDVGGYSNIVHAAGVSTVETWINSLTP